MLKWKGAKVLVAGGAGMIGSHLSDRLVKLGANVTVADNLSAGSFNNIRHISKDIKFEKVDLRDEFIVDGLVNGKDCIFMLAADMGGIAYITAVGADIMFNNTRMNVNMLLAARNHRTPNYYFSSSACVYPNYKQTESNVTALKEDDAYPCDPNEFYGFEKLYCEKLIESMIRDYKMNIRLGRFHNIYGSAFTAFDSFRGKAPCHLVMKAIKHPNPPFNIWGDGSATRSFLYIDDCVDAILRLMDSDYNKPINIGSDRLISINDLAKIVIDISGKKIVPTHDMTKPVGVKGRNSDNTLVSKVLKWQPKIPLEVGLNIVYHWAEEHYNELEGI